jgi:hypothetical protein
MFIICHYLGKNRMVLWHNENDFFVGKWYLINNYKSITFQKCINLKNFREE